MKYSSINKKILIFIPAYNVEKELFSVIRRIPKKIFKNKNIVFTCDSSSRKNVLRGMHLQ